MPRIKIKQLDERVATSGLHMGGGPERRKLEPGEVVEIPEDLVEGGRPLFQTLWNTGKLELTADPVTRPLDYLNVIEAKLCSPTLKSRGPDHNRERKEALVAVAARLAESSTSAQAGSPVGSQLDVDDDDDPEPEPVVTEPPQGPRRNRRAQRRAALQGGKSGTKVSA